MILSGLNRPNGLQISSDGKTAWVVEQTSPTSSIVKINLLDPSDITRISISLNNPTGLAIETDEKTALVTSFSVVGRLAQADLSTGTLTTKVENLLFPTGVVIEDPGKKALITGKTSGKLYRVNLEVNLEDCSRPTSTCSEVMAGFGEPSSPVLSKDRNSVYLLQCKIIDNPLLCVDKFLTKVIVAGPQAPTTSTLTPLGITQPQWFALEPGEHTALITDANPDGIRRVKRN
jgi:DNA-binding beta-propeller fold protein YncE